jgi:superfamily II DNA or RNA helicase
MRKKLLLSLAGCVSWGEIHAKWASFTEKEKGDRFEDLTQAFLQLSPLYRSQLKSIWRLEEVPPAVRHKLKLPATDKGIDLVAETHKGEFWAIQCKYRQNTDQQLTHTDISTFTSLTFQACKGFSFALVCSTTERVTSLYRGEERIGFCALDTWQELDTEFFDQLRAKLTNKPAVLKPCSPRPHQENAVRDGLEHFSKGKAARGKLIMPCGTGKSLTAWFLAQALGSKRIVIAVPSLSLVKQTLKVWSRESAANDIDVDWICVCSDETAGKADQDDVVVQRQDIAVPCYTSTDKIAEWLRTKHKGLTVVFTTYQSGDVLATAARKAKFTFDLGIMDEAHKTVGDSDKQFSILLHDHNIEIGQRIFMTATERRYKGSSDKVLSMDNLEVYGDTFHQLSFKQAMECQPPILCDYNVITIGVSRQEIKDLIKKNVFVRPTGGKWDEEMEADMLAAMVALRKAMKEHPIKHAVSFHGSIQRAELFKAHNDTFTQEFPEFGGLETFHVSGQTPTGTRSNIIKSFAKAERSLVTNARCLTEGVDVPGIDCVLFADPRKSTVDIVQAVGRALRPSEGKKLGYVILPVLHETDATSEQVIDSGAFKEILTTISALASNDDRIIEYFRGISQGRNPSGSSRVSFEWDERLAQNIDVAKLVHELEIKCWGRLAKLSWRPFEDARSFARELRLADAVEWAKYCAGRMPEVGVRPLDIPSNPQLTYKASGWMGIGDWLGTGKVSRKHYRKFEAARTWARGLGLKSNAAWRNMLANDVKPADIPANPDSSYQKDGWVSWSDWLGTGTTATRKRKYRPFTIARKFVHKLNLKTRNEWTDYCKGKLANLPSKPDDIPASPERTYADTGWDGFGDWLGTGNIANFNRKYRSFNAARKFARSLKLKTGAEWSAYCKGGNRKKPPLPEDIPACPNQTYNESGWIGMGDWLGTGNVAPQNKVYRNFKEAHEFTLKLKLKNQKQWRSYCNGHIKGLPSLPEDMPANPSQVYKHTGWAGFGHWLGTGTIAPRLITYRDFQAARSFARSLKLKDGREWRLFCKGLLKQKGLLPTDIPKAPEQAYAKQGWAGTGDWLGTGAVATFKRVYLPFAAARDFVHKLRLKSVNEWYLFCKGALPEKGKFPANIPASPGYKYSSSGWNGFSDWLGNGVAPKNRKKA